MDKLDCFQTLHRLFLSHKQPVPLKTLAERLECSDKTVRRLLDDMRDRYHAPLHYCQNGKGWQYDPDQKHQFELPGIWLTSHEIQALAMLIQLLNNLGEGILKDELGVIQQHINQLLKTHRIPRARFDQLIKIIPINHNQLSSPIFTHISTALAQHQQLTLHYRNYQQQKSVRTISPQTLVYYRDNWYLDAWCHLRNDLRTFSLARIEKVEHNSDHAITVEPQQLQEHFQQGYGIFSGKARHTAKLRFYAEISREISLQQWHPAQQGEWDGSDYLLTIPYSDNRELVQDILRHSPHVYVEAPVSLRKAVTTRLHGALEVMTQRRIPRP